MIVRVLFIVRRRWPILVVIPLLAAAAGYVLTPRGAAKIDAGYSSTALISVDQDAITSPVTVEQHLLEAENGQVAAAVAEQLSVSKDTVADHIKASFDEESFTVTIVGGGETATEAEGYAGLFTAKFAEQYNGTVTQQQEAERQEATEALESARAARSKFLRENQAALSGPEPPPDLVAEAQTLDQAVQEAQSRLNELESKQTPTERYRVVSVSGGGPAAVDKLQLPASTGFRMTLGFIFGLIGAIVLVAIVERLNPRIDDPTHATEIVGAPVLAMVPVMSRRRRGVLQRVEPSHFSGPFAEAFRALRTHLDFRAAGEGLSEPPCVMVTSATPAEGKTTTAGFLALAYAEAGRPPVAVGGDLRRPSLHNLFQLDRLPGLSSRSVGGAHAVALNDIVKTDPVTGVLVVPPGPPVKHVSGVLGDLRAVTAAGRKAGRTVIVDTAPVMVANDATDFLAAADWVLVVVRVGRSTERAVKQMVQSLRLNNADIVGVVMIGSMESSDAKRYYYTYYSEEMTDAPGPTSNGSAASSNGQSAPVPGYVAPGTPVG